MAKLDPNKPKQANLRRAVSSAYYSLFQYLVDESCQRVIGTTHAQRSYRHVLGRAFAHNSMKEACKRFSGGSLPSAIQSKLPTTFAIPVQVKAVASVFVESQEKRHTADYDLTQQFKRSDVLTLINEIEVAIRDFRDLGMSDEKRFFLACLWAWNQIARR